MSKRKVRQEDVSKSLVSSTAMEVKTVPVPPAPRTEVLTQEVSTTEEPKGGDSTPQVPTVEDRLKVLDQIVTFKGFLGCAFEPEIGDCEIVVAFVDIRGFTAYCRNLQKEMQDRKIQNFLRAYFRIYVDGLMQWFVDHGDTADPRLQAIKKHIVPTMYKNLGDGMMLVWEVPTTLELLAQGQLAQHIIFVLDNIMRRFYLSFRDLLPLSLDSFSKAVEELNLGVGLAKGHAWRLDFGNHLDYAGSIINLASRLQELARPAGIVCQYDVSNWLLDRLVDSGEGVLAKIEGIKGYGSSVEVWTSGAVNTQQPGISVVKGSSRSVETKVQNTAKRHVTPRSSGRKPRKRGSAA